MRRAGATLRVDVQLVSFYGAQRTVTDVLQRMPCSGDCGGRVAAAWLTTGPIPNARVRPRRVPLRGARAATG